MRIISGIAKGRRLASPSGSHIRPVLDQVKEAIFNILFDVSGTRVLDLFAGTGSIGLEAVSRGASHACFVDNNSEAIKTIRKNIDLCGFEDRCKLIPKHADRAIKLLAEEGEKFDLIFVDPPYLKNLVVPSIEKVMELNLLAEDGKIITEHHPKEPINRVPAGIQISDQRKYGQTLITFLSRIS